MPLTADRALFTVSQMFPHSSHCSSIFAQSPGERPDAASVRSLVLLGPRVSRRPCRIESLTF